MSNDLEAPVGRASAANPPDPGGKAAHRFGLPTALAAYGPISLVAMVLVTLGALALAFALGALSKRVPGSGGPYVYARDAFGDFAGFLNAWSYWITAWAGNAAIVV